MTGLMMSLGKVEREGRAEEGPCQAGEEGREEVDCGADEAGVYDMLGKIWGVEKERVGMVWGLYMCGCWVCVCISVEVRTKKKKRIYHPPLLPPPVFTIPSHRSKITSPPPPARPAAYTAHAISLSPLS